MKIEQTYSHLKTTPVANIGFFVTWLLMALTAESAVVYQKPNVRHVRTITPSQSGDDLLISFGPNGSELAISLTLTSSIAESFSDDGSGGGQTWTFYQHSLLASLVTPSLAGSFGIGYISPQPHNIPSHYPLPYASGILVDNNLDNWLPNWTTPANSGYFATPFTVGSLDFEIGTFFGSPNDFLFYGFYGMLDFDYGNTNIDFEQQSSWPDSFYPIRFLIDGNFHYGYARFSFFAKSEADSVTAGLILHDWAYENTPNTPIAAGAIPEPTAAVVFGVCSISLLVARRRGV